MVPLAEKPDFNGNRHYAFVPVFLLADPIPQRLHPVLQPLAFTHAHAEPHGKTDSLAQPHGHPSSPFVYTATPSATPSPSPSPTTSQTPLPTPPPSPSSNGYHLP